MASGGALSSVELPPDEPADVVAAGFMVEPCLGISEGDQVRVQEEGHLTLEGAAPFGSVKTIFRLSRQCSDPVAVTVWTSIGYGKRYGHSLSMKFEPEHVRHARQRFERRLQLTPQEWRGPLVDVIDTIDNVKTGLASLDINDNFILMEATRLVLERQEKQRIEDLRNEDER
jgi:hypothetical protein